MLVDTLQSDDRLPDTRSPFCGHFVSGNGRLGTKINFDMLHFLLRSLSIKDMIQLEIRKLSVAMVISGAQ